MNSPGTGPNVFFYVGKKLPIGASTGIPIPERNILPVGKRFFHSPANLIFGKRIF